MTRADDRPGDSGTRRELFERARTGDKQASEALARHYLPLIHRWARGRLPAAARGIQDTDDIVQVSVVRALSKLEGFEPPLEAAFLAYTRMVVRNEIRDRIRRLGTRLPTQTLVEEPLGKTRSPLDEALGAEVVEAYEAALEKLSERQKEAIVLRIEMGFSYQEIADGLGSPSADAARMTVSRGLARLAEVLDA